MTTATIMLIIVMALLPTPKISDAELEGFEKLIRGLWRAIVIAAKLLALTIALVAAFYEFGGQEVLADISLAIIGITGLRLVLWAGEFIIPDGLHRVLSEKTDPGYLLKLVF
jgi:hypothetical protein